MQDNGRRTCAIGSSVVLLIGMIILVVALEPKSTAASAGALGLMAAAILDIVFYFLFANETDSGFSAFIKNALYYILVVVEILVGLCVAFLISQEFEYTEIERDSTWLVALAPAFAFGVILKPVFYRLRANVELTPFISILSHAAGYLVGLLVLFLGEMAPFIFNWGSLILFGVGLVVAFKFIFIGLPFHEDDAYVYGDGGYSYSSSTSSSGSSYGGSYGSSYSGSSNNSKTEYTGSGSFTYKGYSGSYRFENYSHWSKSKLVIKYPLNEIREEHGYFYISEADVEETVLELLGVPWDEIDIELNIYGF